MTFLNNSNNVTSQVWKVDGVEVSSEKNLDYTFYDSGKHIVELEATNGSKIVVHREEVIIDAPEKCLVLIRTSLGNLVVSLSEETPGHQKHFIEVVESGYYDGIFFHRVIDNFMIQGGDNNSRNGGKRIKEPVEIPKEFDSGLLHYRGALAAARTPDEVNPEKKSSGSQFYIVDGRSFTEKEFSKQLQNWVTDYSETEIDHYLEVGGAPQLDGEYTVFGMLVDGYDVLDKIAQTTTDNSDKPVEEVLILEARTLN